MQQFGTWGDHVTLQAVADAFGVRIAILTSFQDGCVVEIQPQGQVKSQRILYLSFWAEVSFQVSGFADVKSTGCFCHLIYYFLMPSYMCNQALLLTAVFACRCITIACILKAKYLSMTQKAKCWAVRSLDGSCMLLLFDLLVQT